MRMTEDKYLLNKGPKTMSLGDPRRSNPVLAALKVTAEDRIISVKENARADSNFVLTHLIKQILFEKNKFCLVSLHNSLEHYQNVGRKLGFDLLGAVAQKEVSVIDPIKDIVDNIGLEGTYFQNDKEDIVKCLYIEIKKSLDELLAEGDAQVYLIIDDLSHLLDLGVDIDLVINFTNYCINLINNERVSLVVNSHVSTKVDEIICSNLQYIADVHIDVSSLKTGRSVDVTGFITIERLSVKDQFHFKAFDRGVKTFHPGESIYHLYK